MTTYNHEIHLGRIASPFEEPLFQLSKFSSRFGPKTRSGQSSSNTRSILPKGDPINSYTSREFTTIQYETLDKVVELVRSCGRIVLIGKAGIQEAFRLIPIRSLDYPLLGFTWKCRYYHDKVLPMGSAVSCQTFERFSRALQWILQTHFNVRRVTHFLDEYIFLVQPISQPVCIHCNPLNVYQTTLAFHSKQATVSIRQISPFTSCTPGSSDRNVWSILVLVAYWFYFHYDKRTLKEFSRIRGEAAHYCMQLKVSHLRCIN